MAENIVPLGNLEPEWKSFVEQHPQGNIFQSPAIFHFYLQIPGYTPGAVALTSANGKILGVLLYVVIAETGWKKKLTRRALIIGGPLTLENNGIYSTQLINHCAELTRKSGAIYTEIRHLFANSIPENEIIVRNQFHQHLNLINDLSLPVSELYTRLHKKRRSNIRRSEKKGVEVKVGLSDAHMEKAAAMLLKTYDRIHLPAPAIELFLKAPSLLGKHVVFAGAFYQQQMIACRMYLLWNKTAYDWYAGSDRDFTHLHPNDILPWKAMMHFKRDGMLLYDFMGAGKPDKPYGVREYKIRFGGELVNFGRHQFIHQPILYSLGEKGIQWYKYLKKL